MSLARYFLLAIVVVAAWTWLAAHLYMRPPNIIPGLTGKALQTELTARKQERRELLMRVEVWNRKASGAAGEGRRKKRHGRRSTAHGVGSGESHEVTPTPKPERKERRSGKGKKRKERVLLALVTTLKACDPAGVVSDRISNPSEEQLLCIRQHNAVQSWALAGAEVHIFGGGKGVKEIAEASGAVHHVEVKSAPSGVPLLNALFHQAEEQSKAPVLGFVNGDIIFVPHLLRDAVRLVSNTFTEFLAVGHRKTVEVTGKVDFTKEGWVDSLPVGKDRGDAEDYFIWTRGFFADRPLPEFRIGRPAFDNWLVNRALTSMKPVVDLTEMVLCFHQKHDYAHIGKSSHKYWDTDDQKVNYKLAVDNGGFQFGLIEFAPWVTAPKGCGVKCRASTKKCTACSITWREGWKALKGFGKTVHQFKEAYEPFLKK
eukprot:Sspe_Gene.1651::Locus_551_Transcript_1_1_Confidence_1.000_Length_1424::g.1651::m.1651